MKQEETYFQGDRLKPLIIFIHGMGMDAKMWSSPALARILGGKYPLSALIKGKELKNSFHDLRERGYSVLAWSQKRPAGPIGASVEELMEIIRIYRSKSETGIIIVSHSRGGLIARLFLQICNVQIRGSITIGTPHKGSSVATLAVHALPITAVLKSLMEWKDKDVRSAMHRVLNFLSSDEMKEMLPGSAFLRSLSDEGTPGVRVVSIGGTDPALVCVGSTSLLSILSRLMPERLLPEEMREGKGDGFVSAVSAVYPGGDEHRNFHANHADLIFDCEAREYILKVVESL